MSHKKKKQGTSNSSSNLKECSFYVDGMHCPSCEILIEKELLKQDGVEFANASVSDGKVQLKIKSSADEIDLDKINKELENVGYKIHQNKSRGIDLPFITIQKGQLQINTRKIWDVIKIFLIVFNLLLLLYIFNLLDFGRFVSIDSNSSFFGFILFGLIAGISSCAALIGGLLLSLTKNWNEIYKKSDSRLEKSTPHVLFHIGRFISFIILGGLLGIVGERISLGSTNIFSLLTMGVSVIMIILALQMLDIKWAQKIKFSLPKIFTRSVADEKSVKGKLFPFITGVGTFFLPCGFTLTAQTIALTSGSFWNGAMIMFAFSIGTFVILSIISFTGVIVNSHPHLTAKFNIIAGIIVLFFALYSINGQLNVLGLPSLNDIKFQTSQESDYTTIDANTDSQTLKFVATKFSYIPQGGTTIKTGVKTKLIVDNQGVEGCGVFMAATGLFDGYITLKPGINEYDFIPKKKGNYKLTCTMGMVQPVVIKVV